jgi:hypothetical protein
MSDAEDYHLRISCEGHVAIHWHTTLDSFAPLRAKVLDRFAEQKFELRFLDGDNEPARLELDEDLVEVRRLARLNGTVAIQIQPVAGRRAAGLRQPAAPAAPPPPIALRAAGGPLARLKLLRWTEDEKRQLMRLVGPDPDWAKVSAGMSTSRTALGCQTKFLKMRAAGEAVHYGGEKTALGAEAGEVDAGAAEEERLEDGEEEEEEEGDGEEAQAAEQATADSTAGERRNWSVHEETWLVRLRVQQELSWPEIAVRLDRTVPACSTRWAEIEAQWREDDAQAAQQAQQSPGGGPTGTSMKGQSWTAGESLRLCRMHRRGCDWDDIAKAVRRSVIACKNQWYNVNGRSIAEMKRGAAEEAGEGPHSPPTHSAGGGVKRAAGATSEPLTQQAKRQYKLPRQTMNQKRKTAWQVLSKEEGAVACSKRDRAMEQGAERRERSERRKEIEAPPGGGEQGGADGQGNAAGGAPLRAAAGRRVAPGRVTGAITPRRRTHVAALNGALGTPPWRMPSARWTKDTGRGAPTTLTAKTPGTVRRARSRPEGIPPGRDWAEYQPAWNSFLIEIRGDQEGIIEPGD